MFDQPANNNKQTPQNENTVDIDAVIDEYAEKPPMNMNDGAIKETQLTVTPSAPPPTQQDPAILVPFEAGCT